VTEPETDEDVVGDTVREEETEAVGEDENVTLTEVLAEVVLDRLGLEEPEILLVDVTVLVTLSLEEDVMLTDSLILIEEEPEELGDSEGDTLVEGLSDEEDVMLGETDSELVIEMLSVEVALSEDVTVTEGEIDEVAVTLALIVALPLIDPVTEVLAVTEALIEVLDVTDGLTDDDNVTDAVLEGVGLVVVDTEGDGIKLRKVKGCTRHKLSRGSVLPSLPTPEDTPPVQPIHTPSALPGEPPNNVDNDEEKDNVKGEEGIPEVMLTRRRS